MHKRLFILTLLFIFVIESVALAVISPRIEKEKKKQEAIEAWEKKKTEAKAKAAEEVKKYQTLTRAETARLIAEFKGFELPDTPQAIFTDVPPEHWAAKYIQACNTYKVMVGYPDKTFKPERKVTLGEFMAIISAAEKFGREAREGIEIEGEHWAAGNLAVLQKAGLADETLEGDARVLNRAITLSEVSEILTKLSRTP